MIATGVNFHIVNVLLRDTQYFTPRYSMFYSAMHNIILQDMQCFTPRYAMFYSEIILRQCFTLRYAMFNCDKMNEHYVTQMTDTCINI